MCMLLKTFGGLGGLIAVVVLLIAVLKQLVALVGILVAVLKIAIVVVFIAVLAMIVLAIWRERCRRRREAADL
jgi:hypothetical protein